MADIETITVGETIYGIGNTIVSDIDFSYNEQSTNKKWVDGKTVYQKSYDVVMPSANANVITNLSNIDTMIDIYATGVSNYGNILPLYGYNGVCSFVFNGSEVKVEYNNTASWYSGCHQIITIRYTKK